MSDGFRHSEELFDEELAEVVPSSDVGIDGDRPGFAALLPLLEAARGDGVDMALLVGWHNELEAQLAEAAARLGGLNLAPSMLEEAAPVLASTRASLDTLGEVLGLLGDYLATGEDGFLDRAIPLLGEAVEAVRAHACGG